MVTFACHDGDCTYTELVDVSGTVDVMIDTWQRFLDVFATHNDKHSRNTRNIGTP
jgi:hypothetical protein